MPLRRLNVFRQVNAQARSAYDFPKTLSFSVYSAGTKIRRNLYPSHPSIDIRLVVVQSTYIFKMSASTDLEQKQHSDEKQYANEKHEHGLVSVDEQDPDRRGSIRILESLISEGEGWI
jgi:hypothetical protein